LFVTNASQLMLACTVHKNTAQDCGIENKKGKRNSPSHRTALFVTNASQLMLACTVHKNMAQDRGIENKKGKRNSPSHGAQDYGIEKARFPPSSLLR